MPDCNFTNSIYWIWIWITLESVKISSCRHHENHCTENKICFKSRIRPVNKTFYVLHIMPWGYKRVPLRWRHNGCDSVSNHQPRDCLLSLLFRRRSKKTWKLRVTGLCVGNSPGPVNSPHKGPVTRKMFPFDDVIMRNQSCLTTISFVECMVAILNVLWSYFY